MAAPLNKLPSGFILDEPDSSGLPPGFALDTPAAPTLGEQAADFGRGVLRGAASTADIIAESAPGTAAMIAYPFQRAVGYLTGQTAEDVAASQERVLGTVAQPIGRMTGVREKGYRPRKDEAAVYDELYGLYMRLHDSFGSPSEGANLFNVMKRLIAIRNEAARR